MEGEIQRRCLASIPATATATATARAAPTGACAAVTSCPHASPD